MHLGNEHRTEISGVEMRRIRVDTIQGSSYWEDGKFISLHTHNMTASCSDIIRKFARISISVDDVRAAQTEQRVYDHQPFTKAGQVLMNEILHNHDTNMR